MFASGGSAFVQDPFHQRTGFESATSEHLNRFPVMAGLLSCVWRCVRNKLPLDENPYIVGIVAGDEEETVQRAESILGRAKWEETARIVHFREAVADIYLRHAGRKRINFYDDCFQREFIDTFQSHKVILK